MFTSRLKVSSYDHLGASKGAIMKSLRELREELTGIRLAAVETSIFNVVTTVNKRALVALNDALRTYEFPVVEVYTSAQLTGPANVIVMPKNTRRILEIRGLPDAATGRSETNLEYRYFPTSMTKYLIVNIHDTMQAGRVDVRYEYRLTEFPEDLVTMTTIPVGSVQFFAGTDTLVGTAAFWEGPGYIEFTNNSSGNPREVIWYESLAHTSNSRVVFRNPVRAVEGAESSWPTGTKVSKAVPIDPEALAVIQPAAEANMFAYLAGHRALYDQYTIIVGVGALDITDILAMVRTIEDRADRRYKRQKKAPAPGRVQMRGRSNQ